MFGWSTRVHTAMFTTDMSTLLCKVVSRSSQRQKKAAVLHAQPEMLELQEHWLQRRSSRQHLQWKQNKKKIKLPGFNQQVHFWCWRRASASNQGFDVHSCSSAVYNFQCKYYFCPVNRSSIWNMNMFFWVFTQTNAQWYTLGVWASASLHCEIINTSGLKFQFCKFMIHIYILLFNSADSRFQTPPPCSSDSNVSPCLHGDWPFSNSLPTDLNRTKS